MAVPRIQTYPTTHLYPGLQIASGVDVPRLYPGHGIFPAVLNYPSDPPAPYLPVIEDAALWDEAEHDAARYVEALRAQGLVGPRQPPWPEHPQFLLSGTVIP